MDGPANGQMDRPTDAHPGQLTDGRKCKTDGRTNPVEAFLRQNIPMFDDESVIDRQKDGPINGRTNHPVNKLSEEEKESTIDKMMNFSLLVLDHAVNDASLSRHIELSMIKRMFRKID